MDLEISVKDLMNTASKVFLMYVKIPLFFHCTILKM